MAVSYIMVKNVFRYRKNIIFVPEKSKEDEKIIQFALYAVLQVPKKLWLNDYKPVKVWGKLKEVII
jgi:hypothetical protein